jgi:hypothetical protein
MLLVDRRWALCHTIGSISNCCAKGQAARLGSRQFASSIGPIPAVSLGAVSLFAFCSRHDDLGPMNRACFPAWIDDAGLLGGRFFTLP